MLQDGEVKKQKTVSIQEILGPYGCKKKVQLTSVCKKYLKQLKSSDRAMILITQ